MASPTRPWPTPAERRAAAKATDSEARKLIDLEISATRKKTERLKALRLAKEASGDVTKLDRKPSKAKR